MLHLQALLNQDIDRLPNELMGLVAKKVSALRIDIRDEAVAIRRKHRFRSKVQDHAEKIGVVDVPGMAVLERHLRFELMNSLSQDLHLRQCLLAYGTGDQLRSAERSNLSTDANPIADYCGRFYGQPLCDLLVGVSLDRQVQDLVFAVRKTASIELDCLGQKLQRLSPGRSGLAR